MEYFSASLAYCGLRCTMPAYRGWVKRITEYYLNGLSMARSDGAGIYTKLEY